MHYVLFLSAAFANDAYYHPNDVAVKSKIFTSVTKRSVTPFEKAQSKLRRISEGLRLYETSIYLLTDQQTKDRYKQYKKDLEKSFTQVSTHSDQLQVKVPQAFEKSVAKAIKSIAPGKKISECTKRSSMLRNKRCTGENLNQSIADYLDNDIQLRKELDTILAKKWPRIAIPKQQFPAVNNTTESTHVHLATMAEELLPDKIKHMRKVYKDAFQQLKGQDKEQSKQLRQQYREAWQQQNKLLMKVIKIAGKKNKAKPQWASLTFCTHPVVFGGCNGTDETNDLMEWLQTNKKTQKLLQRGNSK